MVEHVVRPSSPELPCKSSDNSMVLSIYNVPHGATYRIRDRLWEPQLLLDL